MDAISNALQKKLLQAGLNVNVEEYLTTASILLVIAVMLTYFLFHMPLEGLAAIIIFGVALIVYIPFRLAKIRAEEAEAELPYVLRVIASEVEAGVPFQQAILDGAKAGKTLGKGLTKALKLYSKGIPMERALNTMGEWYDSENVRRAFAHLGILYQTGREAITLKKISDELLSIHRSVSKRFSAELAMFSLFFITIAGLVPALFEMYISLGSLFMSMSLTPEQAFWIPAVVFPTISALGLAFIYARLPVFMRR